MFTKRTFLKSFAVAAVLATCALAPIYAPTYAPVQQAQAQVAATYFVIDNNGVVTVTTAGAAAINALTMDTTYVLTVAATNAGGTGMGTVTINITVPVTPPAPPVINSVTFGLMAPVTDGQDVGTVTATGNPTSWAITGSSP